MRVRLKGVYKTRQNGRTYYYAWRRGPRLKGEPGSPEFIESYNEAHQKLKLRGTETVGGLLAHYKGSGEYLKLSDRSKKDYGPIFVMIEQDFYSFPAAALSDKRTRGIFRNWRDKQAHTPRKADRMWSVLKRIFNVAKEYGLIDKNPCEGGGRLYHGTRVANIWEETDIQLVKARCPPHIVAAMILATNTGQRQADLLELLWSDIDQDHIKITQNKTGKRVLIRQAHELKDLLADLKCKQRESNKLSTHVLTNSRGRPWTSDGFKTSWGKAVTAAGIQGLTFNDLRGTAITRWAEADATVPQIAALSGHSLKDVEKILEQHYLSMSQKLGDEVILRMERERKLSKLVSKRSKPDFVKPS